MSRCSGVRRGPSSEIERSDLDVMFVEVDDVPDEIHRAWDDLERRIGSLRGRTFIGAFRDGRYRASTVIRDGDDPATLGLDTGTIAGGWYVRRRLRGDPDALYADIPEAMEELASAASIDSSRPCLEWYRRLDEVDLLVPILGA
jgi:hypothetical protein